MSRALLQGLFPWTQKDGSDRGLVRFRTAFRSLPEIAGDRVLLRAPKLADADDLYSFARDEENSHFVLWDAHKSREESKSVLRGMLARQRKGLPPTFAIVLRAENRMIGTLGFQWVDVERMRAEIGYSLARRLWNKGLTTEALRLVLPYAFDVLALRRLEARHDELNPASGRVLLKAGFSCLGPASAPLEIKGRSASVIQYVILREDWHRQQGGENDEAQQHQL